MSRGTSRLSRLGVLAPAALSVCMDASVFGVPAAGAIVSTVLKELSKAFMLKKWFHGVMSAKEAEHLIMEKGKNGSFLVRESLTHPGEYVLSVRVRGRVSHVMIRKQQNKYDVGSGEQFDDLVGLIEHFRAYPMIETSGDVLRLLQPVSGTCLRANDIDKKVQEMDEARNLDHYSGFDEEFQSLKIIDDIQYTSYASVDPKNAHKNRYRNVMPYDQTRVVLQKRSDRDESDYINANYIRYLRLSDSTSPLNSSTESLTSARSLLLANESKKSAAQVAKSQSDDTLRLAHRHLTLDKMISRYGLPIIKNKVYIATQGCLINTKDDFWRMLWQEDVRVVAMLTNEVEKGKKKCERYWPQSGQQERYDDFIVKSTSESCYEDYLLREFVITHRITRRTIYQYQFTNWPDHGTPAEPEGILAFMEDINTRMCQVKLEKDAPEEDILCVHCSAGVGRTGTFIVLDMLLDKIRKYGPRSEIDIQKTVRLVRKQRSGMVQNKGQYRFIYVALQNYLNSNNIKLAEKIYIAEV